MISTGIDIESIARVGKLAAKSSSLERVFTAAEIGSSPPGRSRARRLAGSFAAKEACAKAFGTGFGSALYFKEIEVVRRPCGPPQFKLSNKAAALLGERTIHLSIAYAGDIATALVVIEDRSKSNFVPSDPDDLTA